METFAGKQAYEKLPYQRVFSDIGRERVRLVFVVEGGTVIDCLWEPLNVKS